MAEQINNEPVSTNSDDSMYFDTEGFDFLTLDDVVDEDASMGVTPKDAKDLATGKAQTKKQAAKDKAEGKVTAEDIEVEEEAEDADDVDFDELDEDEESEDEDADEADDSDEEGDIEVTDEDGEEVDFENYEITLPSGDNVVLKDLVQGYKDAQKLEAEKAEFENVQKEFLDKSESLGRMLELARLEADKVIEDYTDFDWAAYKKDDPVGYVENREFLDLYKRRRDEIQAAQAQLEEKKAATEKAEFESKAREAATVLARDIPGWSNDLYQELMLFAVENGSEPEEIAKCVDPVVFKVLHKAMQFDKGQQVVKAKMKRIGSPTKVVKPSAKPTSSKSEKDGKKTAVMKKLESGNFDERDLSNSFAFLED